MCVQCTRFLRFSLSLFLLLLLCFLFVIFVCWIYVDVCLFPLSVKCVFPILLCICIHCLSQTVSPFYLFSLPVCINILRLFLFLCFLRCFPLQFPLIFPFFLLCVFFLLLFVHNMVWCQRSLRHARSHQKHVLPRLFLDY